MLFTFTHYIWTKYREEDDDIALNINYPTKGQY